MSSMPASTTLNAKVKKEMVPPNMQSSETGAQYEMSAALFHHGKRLLKMPNILHQLKEGDTVKHLAKVGSDFATGFGKVQQKKESASREAKTVLLVCVLDQVVGSSEHIMIEDI